MEDILYDIHLAQSIPSYNLSYDERAAQETTLRKSIMDKYGVSQAQWDSSMQYYCRHTEQLYDIYTDLQERFRQNLIDAGGDVNIGLGENADTSDVWTADRSIVLMQNPPYNVRSYTIEADSTYLPGDRLTLSFTPQFLYQDGMRDLACVFTVTLRNDSVISEVRHSNASDMITSMTIEDRDDIGIKNVRLYFLCSRNISESLSTTLRLVFVNNIKLIHNHCDREKKEEEKHREDSMKVQRDSIQQQRPDLPPLPPHAQRPVDEVRMVNNPPRMLPARER